MVTFWAFVIETPDDAPEGTELTVDAITIPHKANVHQVFGKAAQSSPVQCFHPHQVYFDENNCVIGLESLKADFKVQHKTIILQGSDGAAGSVAIGTIGDMWLDNDDQPICPVANLGITSAASTSIP